MLLKEPRYLGQGLLDLDALLGIVMTGEVAFEGGGGVQKGEMPEPIGPQFLLELKAERDAQPSGGMAPGGG
jgi:hypothetical protein